ncbi:Uncharacterised protein at_DN0418 [Pycnogonum litorale]
MPFNSSEFHKFVLNYNKVKELFLAQLNNFSEKHPIHISSITGISKFTDKRLKVHSSSITASVEVFEQNYLLPLQRYNQKLRVMQNNSLQIDSYCVSMTSVFSIIRITIDVNTNFV